jgi:hypothetical protein
MASFLSFLQLLVTLGPQFAVIWQQIMVLVQSHNGGPQNALPRVAVEMATTDEYRLVNDIVGNAAGAVRVTFTQLFQVWSYIQQHPELVQAVEAIIAAFTKFDPSTVKLGKRPAAIDRRTLALENYVHALQLPSIPHSYAWSGKVSRWGMMLNNQIGCCAIAGPGHLVEAWNANDGRNVVINDNEVLREYEKVGGYNPNDPSTDQGCVLLDVMRTWQRDGLFGHKVGAFASVSQSHDMVAASMYLFGGLVIGLALPIAAQNQTIWDAPSAFHRGGIYAPGSWGGHCVILLDYDATYLTCITWGAKKKLTWAFLDAYCDERYAAISTDFLGPDNKAPNGFDSVALAADLAMVRKTRLQYSLAL